MAISKRRRRQGQFQHQRDSHGGRHAGATDHFHGHHAHVAEGRHVDLAKVNNPVQMPDADKEDALIVAVMRQGDVFFGKDRIEPDQLPTKSKTGSPTRRIKRVYVRADARASTNL